MEIKVEPRQIAVAFLVVAAVLTIINSILLFFYFYLGDDELFGLIDFFDFDIEGNIPTLYSAVSLLFCSVLLALTTHVNWRRPDGKRFYWLGLTVVFVLLAIDEGTAIHEEISTFLERYMDARGTFYFLWVIPYGIGTTILAFAYFRFVWELPNSTRTRVIVAGGMFLTGALGVEMLPIVLFIYTLLSHLAHETGRLSVVLELDHDSPFHGEADVEAHGTQGDN